MSTLQIVSPGPTHGPDPTRLSRVTTRVHLELRKMLDTQASIWLTAVAVAVSVLTCGLVAVGSAGRLGVADVLAQSLAPLVILVPVLGILAVCAEWRHGTAVTTYAVDPARTSVLMAKLMAVGVVVLVVVAVAVVTATIAVPLTGGSLPGVSELLALTGGLVVSVGGMTLIAMALGAALLRTGLALVAYFFLPQLVPQLLAMWKPTSVGASYLDAYGVFLGELGGRATPQPVAIACVVLGWIVLPLTVGAVRNARRDV